MFFERNLKKFLPCGFLREEVCIYIRRAWFLKKFQRDGFAAEQVFYILECAEGCVSGESFYEGEECMWGVWKEIWGMFLGGFEGLNGVDVGWRNVWLNLWYRITRYKKYGFPVHGFTFLVGGENLILKARK